MTERIYTSEFFDFIDQGSLTSARAILPHVNAVIRPKSVVDVGCGRGAWLRVWQELGVQDILGIDGPDIEINKLQITAEKFAQYNLEESFEVNRRFDLAMCLETAEHLAPNRGDHIVQLLVNLADVVLFSAAIPFQGGTHHINLQWPEYWAAMFRQRGFVAVDYVRPLIWKNDDVQVWFAQNTLLFVDCKRLPSYPELASTIKCRSDMIDVVHPKIYLEVAESLRWMSDRFDSLSRSPRELLKAFPNAVSHAISKAFRKNLV